jgi:DNA integrity scanning protein DisA with diadenylate cyclase activity
MPVDEAFKIMESRVQMQKLVQIDEKIRGMLENVRKRKEFSMKDKEESLKQVNKMFDVIYKRLEERKNTLYQAIIAISDQEVNKIDALIESISACKDRSSSMFNPISSTTAIGYARSVEKVIDFVSDMKEVQLPQKLSAEIPKVNVVITEELIRQVDNLGNILTTSANDNPLMNKLSSTLQKTVTTRLQDQSLLTNDFSKPKTKLSGSRILPEMA